MARPLNRQTSLIRNAVTAWLSRNKTDHITVPLLLTELGLILKVAFRDSDLNKAMSNELKRREDLGLLECVGEVVVGLGRPPKVYKQKWIM